MENLWKKTSVTKRLLNFIFDEGHCISQWGAFRKEYQHLGSLRYLIPEHVPFYVPSATLLPIVLLDIAEILHLRPAQTEYIMRSNDRPEIRLVVRSLTFTAKSFQDLGFLIPDNFKEGDPPLEKFLIFFDDRKEAERACKSLRARMPPSLREKIRWFHSVITDKTREDDVEAMRKGEIWGFCCTDSFGMVISCNNLKFTLNLPELRVWTSQT